MATQIFLGMPPENIKKWIEEHYVKPEVDMTKVPLTFTAEEVGAKLSLVSKNGPTVTLETSPTGKEGSWTPYEVGTEITLENAGDKVMFRNASDTIQVISNDSQAYNYFDINSGKIAASGNIIFLMDKTGELRDLSYMGYCYACLFKGCTSLTQAPELPATYLAEYCYQYMFQDCTSLTQAPELPATYLDWGCYHGMFQGCTALTQAPALLATSSIECCYFEMFKNCTSLTQAPELPATTVAMNCYWGMFDGCTNIPEPKYKIPNLTFDKVSNDIQYNNILGFGTYEVQCSDKALVATYDEASGTWTIT